MELSKEIKEYLEYGKKKARNHFNKKEMELISIFIKSGYWIGRWNNIIKRRGVKMTKKLHEKTISELTRIGIMVPDLSKKSPCKHPLVLKIHRLDDELKQWAIAKNNHCKCINKGKRCDACVSRIRDFEIAEEDLK